MGADSFRASTVCSGRLTRARRLDTANYISGVCASMSKEQFQARGRSYADVRQKGAVGSLNDGIEIETHGVRTRLVSWPGNAFLMHSIHVLTLQPGDASAMYQYDQG